MSTLCTPPNPATSSASPSQQTPVLKPRYHVSFDKEAHTVTVELPGIPKANVSISLDENVLTVQARRRNDLPADRKPLHQELSKLDYLLRLRLTAPVDEARLSAKMEDGLLVLTLPVAETAKPRRIEIA